MFCSPNQGILFRSIGECLLFLFNMQVINYRKRCAYVDVAKGIANGMVEYICHPVAPIAISNGWDDAVEPCDVLIWGDILPYKGVLEFISN